MLCVLHHKKRKFSINILSLWDSSVMTGMRNGRVRQRSLWDGGRGSWPNGTDKASRYYYIDLGNQESEDIAKGTYRTAVPIVTKDIDSL